MIRRRALLRELIPNDGSIQFSDHFVASGKEIFEAGKGLGLEGIVSKRAKAFYRSGPSRNWLKTKNYAEGSQECSLIVDQDTSMALNPKFDPSLAPR